MNWNTVFGIACILASLLPVVVILINRFYKHRSLAALLIYFILLTLSTMMSQHILPLSESFQKNFGLLNNYTDAPLMLTALSFFCPNRQKQTLVRILLFSFIAFELVVTAIYGFNRTAVTFILAPGLGVVFIYASYLFIRQVKFSILHSKNQGRMVMLAAILFVYSCYGLIYYFHYIMNTPFTSDVYLLYYISSFIASTMMGVGLHLMRRRMRELHAIRQTRKELRLFFGH
jgi:hypothetical protein